MLLLFATFGCQLLVGQSSDSDDIKELQSKYTTLYEKYEQLEVNYSTLSKQLNKSEEKIKRQNKKILDIEDVIKSQKLKIDDIDSVCDTIRTIQDDDRKEFSIRIDSTDESIQQSNNILNNRTIIGGVIVLVILLFAIIITYIFYKRIKFGASTIDNVRKAQESLQAAQLKMQEDSVKLDNQLLILIEKQINYSPVNTATSEVDHSLALKVADEIVRIELNLSRMDSSVKGYKQLAKAVERIKNNFLANGYEIIDMLGKPYNEGMKVVANFVPDDTLKEGEQIITGITKPQINYNGQMIQSAQITVSQNI